MREEKVKKKIGCIDRKYREVASQFAVTPFVAVVLHVVRAAWALLLRVLFCTAKCHKGSKWTNC